MSNLALQNQEKEDFYHKITEVLANQASKVNRKFGFIPSYFRASNFNNFSILIDSEKTITRQDRGIAFQRMLTPDKNVRRGLKEVYLLMPIYNPTVSIDESGEWILGQYGKQAVFMLTEDNCEEGLEFILAFLDAQNT